MSSPQPTVAATGRDPWLDNAKLLLITLVVVGHAWEMLPSRPVLDQLYDWLYLWHMPAFVLVTGYLSRRAVWSRAKIWQNVRTLAVPYLFFEAAMALFRIHVGGETLEDLWLNPHWPLWYLAAVFVWRMAAPALRAIPGAVVVAVGLCVVGGLWSNDVLTYLDLARILGFLPFFVIGLRVRPEHLSLLRRPAARVVGFAVLLAALVGTRFIDNIVDTEWLYYRSGYDVLGVDAGTGIATRLVVLAVGLVCALSFLALAPTFRTWFTALGAATMTVYLFHGFAIKGADYAGVRDWAEAHPVLAAPALAVGGVVLTLLLAARPVARWLERAADPFGHAERRAREAVALAEVATDPVPAAVRAVVETTEPTTHEPVPTR